MNRDPKFERGRPFDPFAGLRPSLDPVQDHNNKADTLAARAGYSPEHRRTLALERLATAIEGLSAAIAGAELISVIGEIAKAWQRSDVPKVPPPKPRRKGGKSRVR